MAWIVRLVSLGAEGEEHSTDVLRIAKPGDLTDLASLGLTLAEGKLAALWRDCLEIGGARAEGGILGPVFPGEVEATWPGS